MATQMLLRGRGVYGMKELSSELAMMISSSKRAAQDGWLAPEFSLFQGTWQSKRLPYRNDSLSTLVGCLGVHYGRPSQSIWWLGTQTSL
jgi:hypothetical protein